MTDREEIDVLIKIIIHKNNLLAAYRIRNHKMADSALTNLEKLYDKLGYEPGKRVL